MGNAIGSQQIANDAEWEWIIRKVKANGRYAQNLTQSRQGLKGVEVVKPLWRARTTAPIMISFDERIII